MLEVHPERLDDDDILLLVDDATNGRVRLGYAFDVLHERDLRITGRI